MSGKLEIAVGRGEYTAFGYRSATMAIREGRTATRAGGERHTMHHRQMLVDQSRQFMRDNGIYKGMIERAVCYIVGNGFKLQARTGSKTWNAKAEKLWNSYWRRPEIKQVLSGGRVERMIARELLVAGDHPTLKTDSGYIQLLEADQIAGPDAKTDGIIKSTGGAPLAFWVAPYKNGLVKKSEAELYAAEDVIYLTDPERPSGVRGVPALQSAFPMIHRINDVCDSEAIAWQMLARIALSINKDNAEEAAYGGSIPDPNRAASDDSIETRLTELDYALIFHGKPGEEIKGIERNIPGKNFSDSLRMFLRLLGLPIGLPLEIILLDWTGGNYSQSRAVLEQAFQTFMGWQQLLEDFFHRVVYPWKVSQWMNEGELPYRADAFDHGWIRPTFPWIDQLKETEAYSAKVDRSFATHGGVCKSLNQDRDDIIAEKRREVEEAIQIVTEIETKTGVKVPWQIFAGMGTDAPKAPEAKPAEDPEDAPADKKPAENKPNE